MAAAPPPAPSPTAISSKTVERAVNALLKWRAAKSKTQRPQLLEQEEFVYLILTLKKIPQRSCARTNAYKIPLPHPLVNPSDEIPEFCLIIDDRPKSGLNKDSCKQKIKNDSVPISKIIKFSKLKTDYRPFEAKRKLCGSYEMFFADRRVIPLLPKCLGKHFFKKKKIPVALDLKHGNWKEQVERACSSAFLFLRTGTCSVVKVGKLSMERQQIVENVVAAIKGIAEIVPRKWSGIRSFHVKLLESLALPVYQVLPDLKLKIEGVKYEEEKAEEEMGTEELMEEAEEIGKKRDKKKKGRIHEVRYMDSNVDSGEDIDEDDLENGGEEDADEDFDDNAELAGGESEGKKRKKGEKLKDKSGKKKVKREDGAKKMRERVKNEDAIKKKKQKKKVLH